jgi:hypothetical protein
MYSPSVVTPHSKEYQIERATIFRSSLFSYQVGGEGEEGLSSLHSEMENIIEVLPSGILSLSAQHAEYKSTDSPLPSFKCYVLREDLS